MGGIKWGISRKIAVLTGSLLMLLVISSLFIFSELYKDTKIIEAQGRTAERLELVNAVNRNFSNLRYWLSDLAIGGEYETEQKIDLFQTRGVAIFAKACFGHPSPSKRQKLNATTNAFGAPDVLRTCHFATPS